MGRHVFITHMAEHLDVLLYFQLYRSQDHLSSALSGQSSNGCVTLGICSWLSTVVLLLLYMAYPFYGSGPWLGCDDPSKDSPLFCSPIHYF